MVKTTAVVGGMMKLALCDIDQAILRLRLVQQDLGPNVELAGAMERLVAVSNDLDRFADQLRGR